MTDKVNRFATLGRLAGAEEQKVTQQLARFRAEVDAKAKELARLREYFSEYESENAAATAPARWENYRHFLSKLSLAIRQQEAELATARRRFDEEASKWQQCHAQTRALDELLAQFELEDRLAADRRAQKELDDQIAKKSS